MKRSFLITTALPYANGDIHLGNLVEYVQADFWARHQRMAGHTCVYLCADDAHGTPIMLSAKQAGITPEALIQQKKEDHLRDFVDFEVHFDHYSSTHTDTNRILCEGVYQAMQQKGYVFRQRIQQFYSQQDKMFLPDRFVKGICPACKAPDQYGDNCDICGSTYAPTELISPYSTLSGDVPLLKESEHLFFNLDKLRNFLQDWVPKHTSKEVAQKMQEWLQHPLKPWNISREAPYFGFAIPGEADKFFYVWVDAPLGYLAATKEWCKQTGRSFDAIWRPPTKPSEESEAMEIIHFLGKDIIYFHALFFPAMLSVANFRMPSRLWVHGFLTLNGNKMSKSKGTLITARQYLHRLSPTALRYYYACKVGAGIDDVDLNLEDFVNRINSDLVGKITNLLSRSARLLHSHFKGQITDPSPTGTQLLQEAHQVVMDVRGLYDERHFPKAQVCIRDMADKANRYFDSQAPWKEVHLHPKKAHQVLSDVLGLFRIIAICLKPIIPSYATQVERLFNEKSPWTWTSVQTPLTGRLIKPYEPLMTRLDAQTVQSLLS